MCAPAEQLCNIIINEQKWMRYQSPAANWNILFDEPPYHSRIKNTLAPESKHSISIFNLQKFNWKLWRSVQCQERSPFRFVSVFYIDFYLAHEIGSHRKRETSRGVCFFSPFGKFRVEWVVFVLHSIEHEI